MSEEIKNEEQTVDEKINELLSDPLIKDEEDRQFLKNVGESVKKGHVPVELLLNKVDSVSNKLNDLIKANPEFASFLKIYQDKMNDVMLQFNEALKKENSGK